MLPEGHHDIELKYTARFAKEGSIISITALILLAAIAVIKLILKLSSGQNKAPGRQESGESSPEPGDAE